MPLSMNPVADLRGARGMRAPLGVQILSISCSFWENLAKSYVVAPWGVGAPPRGNPGSATGIISIIQLIRLIHLISKPKWGKHDWLLNPDKRRKTTGWAPGNHVGPISVTITAKIARLFLNETHLFCTNYTHSG